MNESDRPGFPRGHHNGLVLMLAIVAAYAAAKFWWNPYYVSDPQPSQPIHAKDLADRIDPNSADLSTLAALPMVGEKRAREIIEYRERARTGDGRIAYRRPEDLLRLRGFGTTMINQLEPYLLFPTSAPATTQFAE